jgi:H+/gluconate symporter-like permease
MASAILGKIVAIAIGLFVTALLVPPALVTLAGANVTGVDPNVVLLLQVLLPILGTIAIALIFLRETD